MNPRWLICRECEAEYDPYARDHQGPIYLCSECGSKYETQEHAVAEVSWENKHTPIIKVNTTNPQAAKRFNALQKRGVGPLRSIVQAKETKASAEDYSKHGSGAEDYAQYKSKLGEKRTVKL